MTVEAMTVYGRICARALARAHARSGDRIAIAAYLGKGDQFDRAIATFAERYADQNERDYEALQSAAKQKRVPVESGI
jgi:predicted alpha/beta hydrolase